MWDTFSPDSLLNTLTGTFCSLQSNKLFTADLKAVQFVLNSPNFEKSDQLKFALGELLGNGKGLGLAAGDSVLTYFAQAYCSLKVCSYGKCKVELFMIHVCCGSGAKHQRQVSTSSHN